jgi:aminopeptidase N
MMNFPLTHGPGPARVAALILAAFVCLAGAAAGGDDHRAPVHPGLTRSDFEAAKTTAGIFRSAAGRSGELGDASVTSDRYDLLRCALDLAIDPGARTVNGSVEFVLAGVQPGLRDVVCDLRSTLTVAGVDHASGPLAFTHAGDSLSITLPTALAAGTVDSFTIRYGGQPLQPVINRGLMFQSRAPDPQFLDRREPVVANLSEPAYAQSWWPCKDRPDDKFTVSMAVTVPDTLVAVSNGVLAGMGTPAPGLVTFRWREDYPIASYLVSLAIADYQQLQSDCLTGAGLLPLRHWVFPEDVAEATVDFAPTCEMIQLGEALFGPWPFAGEKYGHAEFLWPGAMEHQTVTSIGSMTIAGDGTRDWLVMHELAHQWFGDSLTPRAWADIWLNEGFATYSEALWTEHREGRAVYLAHMAAARHDAEWADEGPVYDPVPVFPGRVIYDKGAWILHMLRGRLGEDVFGELLRRWTTGDDRPVGTVTTDEFIALASELAGEDLSAFLRPYLDTIELPRVEALFTVEDGLAGPGTRLRAKLSQHQLPLFDNVYPIGVTTAAGPRTVRLRLSGTLAEDVFELDAPITAASLDPEGWLLWTPLGDEAPREGLTAAYPNPAVGDYVVLRYWLAAAKAGRLTIHDARGAAVARRAVTAGTPGLNEYAWDLKGDDGARLPSGVYWAALELDGRRSVRKFVVVR